MSVYTPPRTKIPVCGSVGRPATAGEWLKTTGYAATPRLRGASRLEPVSLRSTGIYARVDPATVPRLFEKIRKLTLGDLLGVATRPP